MQFLIELMEFICFEFFVINKWNETYVQKLLH